MLLIRFHRFSINSNKCINARSLLCLYNKKKIGPQKLQIITITFSLFYPKKFQFPFVNYITASNLEIPFSELQSEVQPNSINEEIAKLCRTTIETLRDTTGSDCNRINNLD